MSILGNLAQLEGADHNNGDLCLKNKQAFRCVHADSVNQYFRLGDCEAWAEIYAQRNYRQHVKKAEFTSLYIMQYLLVDAILCNAQTSKILEKYKFRIPREGNRMDSKVFEIYRNMYQELDGGQEVLKIFCSQFSGGIFSFCFLKMGFKDFSRDFSQTRLVLSAQK